MPNMLMCLIMAAAATIVLPAKGADEGPLTSKQADEIINELREIRKLLEAQASNQGAARSAAQPRSRTIAVDVTGAPVLGSKDAPLAIVQFTDFQCPYCNRFFKEALPDLKKNYIDTGKVRFYSMDFPIKVHPNALRAAEAGRCAADQNQFWAMHDLMQGNPTHLAIEDLMDYANNLRMDVDTFRQCVNSGKYENRIKEDADAAMAKGIRGTPVMIVGRSRSSTVEGSMIMGSVPYEMIDEKLRALLNAGTAQQAALQ